MRTISLFYIYLGVVAFSILVSLLNFRRRDNASRILIFLLILTFLSESTAYIAATKFHTNMFVYHIFAPLQLYLIGKYFDSSIFKQRKIGYLTGLLGIAIAISNTCLFQSIETLNSNFLLFEGLAVMGLALYSFRLILENPQLNIYNYEHFWLILVMIFFWSMTYTIWALYSILQLTRISLLPFISTAILGINIATYFAIGVIFLVFPKQKAEYAG